MALNPINYNVQIAKPLEHALQMYNEVSAIRKRNEDNEKARIIEHEKLNREENFRRDMQDLYSSNPTIEKIEKLRLKYPELKVLDKTFDRLNDEQRMNRAGDIGSLVSAIDSGNLDLAKDMIKNEIEALENSNKKAAAGRKINLLKLLDMNPSAAKTALMLEGQSVTGGKFSELLKEINPDKTYKILSESEITNLGLDPKKRYQIGSDGKVSSIDGGGVTVNLPDTAKPPTGWMRVIGEDGLPKLMPEPGGPADIESNYASDVKSKKEELKARSENIVLDSITNAIKLIDDAKIPITGIAASKIAPGIRQNRVDLENTIKTIRANIGFNRLQEMREASKTGAALGAVSDRELNTLESVLGSLDLNQSENQLKRNLEIIKKIMEKDTIYQSKIKTKIKTNIDSDVDIKNLVYKYLRKKS